MANKAISELDAATTPPDYTEEIEVLQDGDNRRMPLSEIMSNVGVIQFDKAPTLGAHNEGKIYWDDDANTLAIMTDVPNVVLQVGQEHFVKVRNNTGTQLNDGQVVYLTGAIGSQPTVALAQADAVATSDALGMVTEDIANNSNGYVTVMGLVHNLDTSAFSAGDPLYLSDVIAGAVQNVPGVISVRVGSVIYDHPTQGIILVRL